MANQSLSEALGLTPEEIAEIDGAIPAAPREEEQLELPLEDKPEVAEEPENEDAQLEKEAKATGWKAGGKTSAYEWVRYGKLQASVAETKKKAELDERKWQERLDRLEGLHKLELEKRIKETEERMLDSVARAETGEYLEHRKALDELQRQRVAPAIPEATIPVREDPAVIAWKARNTWIADDEDPRAIAAKSLWDKYVAKHPPNSVSVEQVLQYVDSKLSTFAAPKSNPMREAAAPTTETNRAPRSAPSKTLTWRDITDEEKAIYYKQSEHGLWQNREEFLEEATKLRKK